MSNAAIDIVDYDPEADTVLQDPTDPIEGVERSLMDKLAKALTRMEEVLQAGSADMTLKDVSVFVNARGEALDQLDDPEIAEWLAKMRTLSRCPYRRFAVG